MVQGSLVCVGTGITLGSHISPLARSYIEQADVVFLSVADGVTEKWVEQMNADVRSLQPFYCEGKSRMDTYRQMHTTIMQQVRAGKKVTAAFYGHPGVFTWVSHQAVRTAREEGYVAHIEPGISAEDCLYADLSIDPGTYGCQHYEASQFMFYQRQIDTAAYLILWQIGVAGDRSLSRFKTGKAYRQILTQLLQQQYPVNHQVILYEAAVLPIQQPVVRYLPLSALPDAEVDLKATLVIPPATALIPAEAILQQLQQLAEEDRNEFT